MRYLNLGWFGVLAVYVIGCAGGASPQMSYLDNGVIRIGVNIDEGGSIAYLVDSNLPSYNVVNTYDLGRQVGVGFYSGPDHYNPSGDPACKLSSASAWEHWPWNAIQTGDGFGNPSYVETHTNDGTTMYTKTWPKQWALNANCSGIPPHDTEYETWITLDANVAKVHVRVKLMRADTTQYPARHAEMPGAILIGELSELWSYTGTEPWTNGDLSHMGYHGPTKNWTNWRTPENWAALLQHDNDWGVGVYHPGVNLFMGGYDNMSGQGIGIGGPNDPNCGCIFPLHREILDHNIEYYEYDFVLILGNIATIRSWVYQHRNDYPAAKPLPDYQFQSNRQHWRCVNTADTGWPINGHLKVWLNGSHPRLNGPCSAWKANDVPTLYVCAAYHLANPNNREARFYWEVDNEGGLEPSFNGDQSIRFNITADGNYHTYTVDLSSKGSHYNNHLITQLCF